MARIEKNINEACPPHLFRSVKRIRLTESENIFSEKLLAETTQERVFDLYSDCEGEKKYLRVRKKENDLTLRNIIAGQKYGRNFSGYVKWISQPPNAGAQEDNWTFFFTGTTPYTLTQASARRLAERYFAKLQPYCNSMFFVSEQFGVKAGYHLHGLMYCPLEGPFETYRSMYQIATGNRPVFENGEIIKWSGWSDCSATYARVQLRRYDPRLGAEGYVGKYCFKKGGDFDFITADTLPKTEIAQDRQRVPKGFYKPAPGYDED